MTAESKPSKEGLSEERIVAGIKGGQQRVTRKKAEESNQEPQDPRTLATIGAQAERRPTSNEEHTQTNNIIIKQHEALALFAFALSRTMAN